MADIRRPTLAADDDLNGAVDIDIDAVLAPLYAQRTESPIIRPSTAAEVAAMLATGWPGNGESLPQLVAQVSAAADRYPRRNTHPGFFGWIAPSGLPTDALANAMVSVLNANVGGYWASPVGTTIERCVIGWLAELAGFPPQAEGVLLSGGSLANVSGMAAALTRCFGPEYRVNGIGAYCDPEPPVIVCSAAAHFSVRRAAVLLGIGSGNIVEIETDDAFRMRTDRLREVLDGERRVVCVVASAGTTNTGAIDPLADIAELCAARDTWLHVDAAYGAGGLMSPELKPRYRGIERADSVTMDLHKWFFQALDGSLLLYRDPQWARQLFADSSDYLAPPTDESPEQYMFFHIAPELSRRFRGLPVYLALRHYGMDRLGRNALHNVQCAEYLAGLIEAEDELELVVAPQLSILCFRYRADGLGDDAIDRLNAEIRDRIQLEGDFLMSPTRVRGRPVLRVCIMNHATRAEHVEGLLASVLRIGRELVA